MEYHRRSSIYLTRRGYLFVGSGFWLFGARAYFVRIIRGGVFCQFCGSKTQITQRVILKYGMI